MIHEFKPSVFPWSLKVLNQELFCKRGFWEPSAHSREGTAFHIPGQHHVSLEEERGGAVLCSAALPTGFCVSTQHVQHGSCVCVLSCIQLWDPTIGDGGHKSRSQLTNWTPNKNKKYVDIIQHSFTEIEFIFHKIQPLKDGTWWLLVRSQMCYNQHCVLEYLHHPPSPTPDHHTRTFPQAPATTDPRSVSTDLPILDISCRRNHTVRNPVWQGAFTRHHVLLIPPGWVRVTTPCPLLMGEDGMYIIWVHILVCSSPEGHLGLSHFLANMYSAAMKWGVQDSVWACFQFFGAHA